MRRPTTGDKVRIIPSPFIARSPFAEYLGKIGIIEIDEHDYQPYFIRIDDNNKAWFREEEVELVEEKAPSPKRQLKPGDKVRVKSRECCEDIPAFMPLMTPFCGRIVTIAKVLPVCYQIVEDDGFWSWTIGMFDLDEPQEESSAMQASIDSVDRLRDLIHRGKKAVFKEKLPLIKTNKLLTNIKLD